MGVGIMLGSLFGGILAGYSLALPFFTGAGISFIAFLLIVTVLPESIERSGYPHKKDSFDFLALKSILLYRRSYFDPYFYRKLLSNRFAGYYGAVCR